jgi:hypothetical protein
MFGCQRFSVRGLRIPRLELKNVVSMVEGIADKTQLHWRDFAKHTKLDACIGATEKAKAQQRAPGLLGVVMYGYRC